MSYLTRHRLERIHRYDRNDTRLDQYDILFDAIARNDYRLFVTITTETPLIDFIDAETICSKFYDQICSRLYGRQQPKIPFVSVIETNRELFKGKYRYHLHQLVGDPVDSHRDPSEVMNAVRYLRMESHIRYLNSRITYANGGRLGTPHFTEITKKYRLIDYCLKQFTRNDLTICYAASNLVFRPSIPNESHLAA